MSITSPIPVLQNDAGSELRSLGEELLLRHPYEEVRIPLAAIARVRAEGRQVAVELRAPADLEPTVYRMADVSGAAASVFADTVNAALPDRADGVETVDGSTLVVTVDLRNPGEEVEEEEEEAPDRDPGFTFVKWAGVASGVALTALSAAVGIEVNASRGIAMLLLGGLGMAVVLVAYAAIWSGWEAWYLPRYGVTVEGRQVFLDGRTTYAYTDSSGKLRAVSSSPRGDSIRVAYHPRRPREAVRCKGWGSVIQPMLGGAVILAVAAPVLYGTYRLALPALDG
jgi:hypothetical protein